jgi:signal transduction histidine kinase
VSRWTRLLWVALLACIVGCSSHVDDAGDSRDPDRVFINLTASALLWHDAAGDRTLADWQQSFTSPQPPHTSAPGFNWIDPAQMPLKRRAGALWVAVPLDNPHAALLRHLVLGHARMELIDAWLLTGPAGRTVLPLGRSGLSVPLALRPLPTGSPAWAVNLPPGSSTLLLRVQSRTTLQPQLSLWTPSAHTLDVRMADLHEGLQIGALALATLLALVFALWLRESTWAWYGATSASMLLYQSCFSGQAVLWLWPEHPQWTLPMLAAALVSSQLCAVVFFFRFIPPRFIPPWGRVAAFGISGVSLLGFLGVLWLGFEVGITLQEFASFMLSFLLPWLAWLAWRQGDTAARFVLLSYSFLFLASIVRVSFIYGWLTPNRWMENWLLPLAASLTSIVLMLAMADRQRTQRQLQQQASQRYQITLKDAVQEATRELVQARDAAEAATQFKQRFLSRVSHDLRTPLHTLLGNADLARLALDRLTAVGPDTEQARLQESVQAMQRSGHDILQLSDELLELARGEAGRLCLVTAPTDLPQRVQAVADGTRWLALHQNNQLQVHTDLAVTQVTLDAARFEQVLRNLLANACAATHNGVVTLGLRSTLAAEAGYAQLDVWVSDTGRGVAPEALERIFEPFEQIDASCATGNSGLGLAIARQWVRMMGSEISVQSTPGQGSVFTWSMQVPVAEEKIDVTTDAKAVNPAPEEDTTHPSARPAPLDWVQLRTLADNGDGLGVDAWIARHRPVLADDPLTQGVLALSDSLQLAALVRWLDSHPTRQQPSSF